MIRAVRIFAALALTTAVHASNELDESIERIFGTKKEFEPKRFGPAKWRGDGVSYTTLEDAPEAKSAKDLVRYDVESGTREVVVAAARFTDASMSAISAIARWVESSQSGE